MCIRDSAYRLLGFHDEWIYTDADHRFAVYTSLPAGTYTFQVKASNNDGIWNEKSRSLTLIITPPFWQTWWFRILIAAFLVSVIWMIFRIRIMALKKIQDELERKVKEQTAEIVEKNDELVIQTDQLQRSNHDLNVANATKDKLFSIIAHDLKNPFQGIIGLSEILHTKFDSLIENERTEYLYQINISSKNTYTLLENLLTWARNQTQSIQYKPETVSVLSVVNETMGVLNLNLKNKKIGFLNNVLPEHCVISDKNMLTTIIRNLISNAIKFTPELGTISISSERSYDRIMIRIKDTGVGMGQDTINKLFRIDQHHTTRGTAGERGTGLGLMLCRDFIMYNKGTLNIESEPGKGSTFIIGLVRSASVPEPIAENKPVIQPHDEMDATHANHPAGHDHEKVLLLVDDDPSILSSLRKEIEVEYNVYTAENGSEGYKKALAMIPDLIVSDVSMPELNGFEFCGKIKQNKRTSHVPVILLTANDSDKDKMAGLETGADDYITKPFRSELLKVRIRNLIRLREQLKDIYCKKLISLEPVDVEIRNSADRKFIDCCIASIEQNLSDPDYSVDSLSLIHI